MSEPVVCIVNPEASSSRPVIPRACFLQGDETLVEPDFQVAEDDLLKSFVVARTTCQIPLSIQLGDAGRVNISGAVMICRCPDDLSLPSLHVFRQVFSCHGSHINWETVEKNVKFEVTHTRNTCIHTHTLLQVAF